ncbi:MAG: DUF362 domain-containing protein [Candidatus Methanoplasma sp.]|jgi:uncharacterized Fe-S center protein|nr:DUF362 domain-containing protein [Candidatus Methanoplasma sp.]
MAPSKVYFTNMHTKHGDGLLDKLLRLIEEAGIDSIDVEKKFVAIKTHFGELGNLAFLRPNYAKVIADKIYENGGLPFLTDCSTLYVGKRKNGVEHLDTANVNGFNPTTAGCQIIIGDGIKGTDDVEIPVKGYHVKTAKIGRTIADADVIISLNHFKGHELTGFGGALKNLGMGCASRRGKMELHTSGKPSIDEDECRGCKKCLESCAQGAITITDKKAVLDYEKCVGCGRCIGACPFDAVSASMDEALDIINHKIVEYTIALLAGKPNFHISVIADVSPFCDCYGDNDVPIIPNVGILASFDPVALDKACLDLSQKQPMVVGSLLFKKSEGRKPDDIFGCIHPGTKWKSTFDHAEKLGFGSSEYELIEVR